MSELQELKVPSQTELAVVNITEAARSIEVVDKPSADKASELIVAGKKLIKAIKDYFDPMKKAADEAKRRILETERQELGKIEPVVADLSAKVSRWLADEERRRREAEEARRQAERDRLMLEAELALKAKEAERIKNESERRVFEDKAINEIAQRELGEWARPEGVIFDWPVEPLPADTKFDSIFYGVDFGFSIDPAAVVKVYRRADYYAIEMEKEK